METTTRTTPDTQTPVKESPRFEPERFYNPERLCPAQRRDGETFARP